MLGVENAILDGEVIAADETGRPQFYDVLRRTRAPAYVAFDILWQGSARTESIVIVAALIAQQCSRTASDSVTSWSYPLERRHKG
jgi:hypothetical protein